MYIFLNLLIFYDIITLETYIFLYIIIYIYTYVYIYCIYIYMLQKRLVDDMKTQGRLQRINPFKEIDGKEYNKRHYNKQNELLEKFSKEIQQETNTWRNSATSKTRRD